MLVGKSYTRFTRLPHHLAADIHGINFAEKARESARHTAGPTADFEYLHIFRIAPVADIRQVVQYLFFQGDLAGLEELLIRPLCLAGHHVMACIFPCPAVPIAAHSDELSG